MEEVKRSRVLGIERQGKVTASDKFVTILALVSILGFAGIVSYTLFDFHIDGYVEALWMLVIGIGFIIEGQLKTLRNMKLEGLTPNNFTRLITLGIGLIAIIAGIFSIPLIRIENHGFLAVKGILSLLAIVVIVVQTWVVK